MSIVHHQHQMSADGRDGAYLVAACRPQAPAVVHYDTQDNDIIQRLLPPSMSLTHTPNLPTGGASRSVLSIPLRLRVASPAVSSRGRTVFVSLPTSIVRPKFLSRCRPVGLRNEAFKPIRRRSGYSAKNVSAVPEAFHVRSLSSAVEPSKGQHAAKVFGNVRKAVGKIRNV